MIEPLIGARVVDFTRGFAGPMCTYQLGLLGAEVIKVERPTGGDNFRERGTIFDSVNAGKRSLALDVNEPSSPSKIRELIQSADIVIHNFLPRVSKRVGLDPQDVLAENPDIVVCVLSGYGARGAWADRPTIEWTAQAATGLMDSYADPEDPSPRGLMVLDPFTGMLAAQSILAAYLEKQRTGKGQSVDVSLLDASLIAQANVIPELMRGAPRPDVGKRVGVGIFRTATGRVYIAAVTPDWHGRLFDVLGIDRAQLEVVRRDSDPFAYAHNLISEATSRWDAAELVDGLGVAGVPAAVVEELGDVLAADHPLSSHISLEQTTGVDGQPVSLVGSAVLFNGKSLGPRGGTPALGEYQLATGGDRQDTA